jgi:hypothetical protein
LISTGKNKSFEQIVKGWLWLECLKF